MRHAPWRNTKCDITCTILNKVLKYKMRGLGGGGGGRTLFLYMGKGGGGGEHVNKTELLENY